MCLCFAAADLPLLLFCLPSYLQDGEEASHNPSSLALLGLTQSHPAASSYKFVYTVVFVRISLYLTCHENMHMHIEEIDAYRASLRDLNK